MSSMSRRIKEIRFDKNLSQVKFAKALDVTSASISYYEAGKRQPDSAFLSKLCERFHVNLNWLLTGEGEMYQQLVEIVMIGISVSTIPVRSLAEATISFASVASVASKLLDLAIRGYNRDQ